jgi:hypothetical protein
VPAMTATVVRIRGDLDMRLKLPHAACSPLAETLRHALACVSR